MEQLIQLLFKLGTGAVVLVIIAADRAAAGHAHLARI